MKVLLFGLDLFIKKGSRHRAQKNILPYEVITLSASRYLCALEGKRVQESRCESLRKHLGAFLGCLHGDIIQPGRKTVEEREGCK